MLMSEMRSVGNKGCLRHTLAAATLGRVHTYLIPQVTPHATHGAFTSFQPVLHLVSSRGPLTRPTRALNRSNC